MGCIYTTAKRIFSGVYFNQPVRLCTKYYFLSKPWRGIKSHSVTAQVKSSNDEMRTVCIYLEDFPDTVLYLLHASHRRKTSLYPFPLSETF